MIEIYLLYLSNVYCTTIGQSIIYQGEIPVPGLLVKLMKWRTVE